MSKQENFFGSGEAVLRAVNKKALIVNKSGVGLEDGLKLLQGGRHLAAAHFVNCVRFAYYENGSFRFANSSEIEEKYLQQLRVFNEQEELYLQRQGDKYYLQYINDELGEKSMVCVDSSSQFFGKRVQAELSRGFVQLWEPGRKIRLVLPASKEAETYQLITRSYVQYDAKTGQAGYSCYRWVAVLPGERSE